MYYLFLSCSSSPRYTVHAHCQLQKLKPVTYDNLPDAGDEDESIAKYRAISQWGKQASAISLSMGRINQQRSGRDLIRAAFKLWADETSFL
jgi:hypothetical protein